MEPADKLKKVRRQLDRNDLRRRELIAERDLAVREAVESGMTWVNVQRLVGLSSRGLLIVLARTEPSEIGEELPAQEGK